MFCEREGCATIHSRYIFHVFTNQSHGKTKRCHLDSGNARFMLDRNVFPPKDVPTVGSSSRACHAYYLGSCEICIVQAESRPRHRVHLKLRIHGWSVRMISTRVFQKHIEEHAVPHPHRTPDLHGPNSIGTESRTTEVGMEGAGPLALSTSTYLGTQRGMLIVLTPLTRHPAHILLQVVRLRSACQPDWVCRCVGPRDGLGPGKPAWWVIPMEPPRFELPGRLPDDSRRCFIGPASFRLTLSLVG